MARVRDRHLGTIQGQVGDQVFKLRGNQSYLSQLPHNKGIAPKEIIINNRMKFGNAARFSIAVNNVDELKKTWDITTPNNISPFNGILRANYSFATSTDISDRALIVPFLGGFPVVTTDVSVDASTVSVTIDPIGNGEGIDTMIEKYIMLCAVIKCTDTVVENLPKMLFISLKSDNIMLNLINPLSFTINLSGAEKRSFSSYDTHLTYLALVTLDDKGNPIHFSESFTA